MLETLGHPLESPRIFETKEREECFAPYFLCLRYSIFIEKKYGCVLWIDWNWYSICQGSWRRRCLSIGLQCWIFCLSFLRWILCLPSSDLRETGSLTQFPRSCLPRHDFSPYPSSLYLDRFESQDIRAAAPLTTPWIFHGWCSSCLDRPTLAIWTHSWCWLAYCHRETGARRV